MKALTICQPYAHQICVTGEKRVENRVWPTRYRGSLLIHAGKSTSWLQDSDLECYPGLIFGAIIGGVTLAACIEKKRLEAFIAKDFSRWDWLLYDDHAIGPWCWILENPHRLATPIYCRGAQGLWTVDNSALDGSKWIKTEAA